MKKTMKKRLREFYESPRFFLFLSIVFFLVILLYLGANQGYFSFIEDFLSEPEEINVEDDCSVIAGRLVHEIRDKEDCKLRCKNVCDMENKEFIASDFSALENSCHTCECTCK